MFSSKKMLSLLEGAADVVLGVEMNKTPTYGDCNHPFNDLFYIKW
jgi:hypothetical protein